MARTHREPRQQNMKSRTSYFLYLGNTFQLKVFVEALIILYQNYHFLMWKSLKKPFFIVSSRKIEVKGANKSVFSKKVSSFLYKHCCLFKPTPRERAGSRAFNDVSHVYVFPSFHCGNRLFPQECKKMSLQKHNIISWNIWKIMQLI